MGFSPERITFMTMGRQYRADRQAKLGESKDVGVRDKEIGLGSLLN